MRLDIYFHGPEDPRIGEILTKLDTIILKEIIMAGELDALTLQVTNNNNLIDSAIVTIQGIKAALDAAIAANAAGNPAALQALSDSLGAKDAELAAAIVANTLP